MTCAVNVADLLRRSSVAQPVRVLRVIIAGSRGLAPNADAIHNAFDRWLEDEDIVPGEIVSGNARGVDRAGEDWAASVGLPIKALPHHAAGLALWILGFIGGGFYAWWGTALPRIRSRCLLDRYRRELIAEMDRNCFVDWAAFAREFWKETP